jgi:hypothetical protein
VIITVAYGPGVFEEHGRELIKLNHEAQKDLIWMGTQLWMVEIIPMRKSRAHCLSVYD